MQHVFIVGSKGIPANYGGYETFVDKLTEYHEKHENIRYHVACKNMEIRQRRYHGARCFNVKVPDIGAAQAIYYDVAALHECCKYIKKHHVKHAIVYVLACRISVFCSYYLRRLHKLGARLFINPDGHEWKRQKWSAPVRRYWRFSEKCMVKNNDLVVCDSKNIEKYIKKEYRKYAPKTTYIAYGADRALELTQDIYKRCDEWLLDKGLSAGNYYLIVGRFVPENNYEVMIREFMNSHTDKKLAIIATADERYYEQLNMCLGFENDKRICFVGTVYDKELLQVIRERAYGYLHGHEVGGTNPSLLEALACTKLNLLLDVGFNKEVGENSAMYWNKQAGSLAKLLDDMDCLSDIEYEEYGRKAKERIATSYSWQFIADEYERLFLDF